MQKIMIMLYKCFLTFNAISLIFVVFIIKEDHKHCADIYMILTHGVAFVPILLTWLSLKASVLKIFSSDSIQSPPKEIENANNSYLPSYLGYFFVALSVPNFETLIFISIIIFILSYFSQTIYFNPLFLIFGYNFYYLTTSNGIKLCVISKSSIRKTEGLTFEKLKRINDFTFIEYD